MTICSEVHRLARNVPLKGSLRISRLLALCIFTGLTFSTLSPGVTWAKPAEKSEAPPAGIDEALRDDNLLRPRGSTPSPANAVKPHELNDALEILRDYRPELFERFEGWASRNPEEARRLLSRSVPMLSRLIRQRREDPESYKLTIQDMRLYRASTEIRQELRTFDHQEYAQRARELTSRLRDVLTRHFDVRQQIREREIAKLQERVEALRKQVDERTRQREKIIEDRLNQLMSDTDRQAW
jgi:hypothetical protein